MDRQLEQRRRRTRNRKLGALGLAAVIGLAAAVVLIQAVDERAGSRPGAQPTNGSGTPTAREIPSLPSGSVEPGRYFSSADPGLDASYRITVDVPEGYVGFEGVASTSPDSARPP